MIPLCVNEILLRMKTKHTGLESLPSKKKFQFMGQVFLYSSDQCGSEMGWQILRKLEKNQIWSKSWSKTPKIGP